jgi:hypothetical protein
MGKTGLEYIGLKNIFLFLRTGPILGEAMLAVVGQTRTGTRQDALGQAVSGKGTGCCRTDNIKDRTRFCRTESFRDRTDSFRDRTRCCRRDSFRDRTRCRKTDSFRDRTRCCSRECSREK